MGASLEGWWPLQVARLRGQGVLRGGKRCRIVKDVFRNGLDGLSDLAIEVACARRNWRLAFRAF